MIAIALMLAITPPTDRSYVTAETAAPADDIAQCTSEAFDRIGMADNSSTDYGRRIDYRFCNAGGCVDSPTVSLEIHDDGEKRELLLYGYKAWRGAANGVWKDLSKRCFPELKDAPLVKPSRD